MMSDARRLALAAALIAQQTQPTTGIRAVQVTSEGLTSEDIEAGLPGRANSYGELPSAEHQEFRYGDHALILDGPVPFVLPGTYPYISTDV